MKTAKYVRSEVSLNFPYSLYVLNLLCISKNRRATARIQRLFKDKQELWNRDCRSKNIFSIDCIRSVCSWTNEILSAKKLFAFFFKKNFETFGTIALFLRQLKKNALKKSKHPKVELNRKRAKNHNKNKIANSEKFVVDFCSRWKEWMDLKKFHYFQKISVATSSLLLIRLFS